MMTDERRRKLRRILMLACAPVALAAVLVGSKLISVNLAASAEQTAFQRRAWAEAQQHAGVPFIPFDWNVIEPWKALFNRGVALGMGGRLPEARDDLERSLTLQGQPGSNEFCVVLTSLIYVVEKQGDEARDASDQQAANGFYREALALIEEAPEGCIQPPEDPDDADTQAQLEASQPRIEEKIVEDDSDGGGGGDGESESETESDPNTPPTQQEQLEESNQEAQEQQQAQEEYYEQQQDGEEGGGGGVEHPW